MKTIYNILLVSALGLSFVFARTSGKFETADGFLNAKNISSTKKAFKEEDRQSSDQSVKWKRRHKRRKKDKNRRPQRGR